MARRRAQARKCLNQPTDRTIRSGMSKEPINIQGRRRTRASTSIFPLMQLPAEVRLTILRYLLKSDEPITWDGIAQSRKDCWKPISGVTSIVYPAILSTSRQLFDEGRPIFCKENTFATTFLLQDHHPYWTIEGNSQALDIVDNAENLLINLKAPAQREDPFEMNVGDTKAMDDIGRLIATFSPGKRITVDAHFGDETDPTNLSRLMHVRCKEITFKLDGQIVNDKFWTKRFEMWKTFFESSTPVLDVPMIYKDLGYFLNVLDTAGLLAEHDHDVGEADIFKQYNLLFEDVSYWDYPEFVKGRDLILKKAKELLDLNWSSATTALFANPGNVRAGIDTW